MAKRAKQFEQQHQDTSARRYLPIQRALTWGAIAGAAIGVVGGAINANNNKPGAPVFQAPLDIGATSRTAIDTNLKNQTSIEALLSRGNAFNQDQALSLFNQAFPGYDKLSASLTKQAQDAADNPYAVPKEVEDNLSRLSAEKGISVGGRGQFSDFSLLRDLGVNQLQYGQARLGQAQSITSLLGSLAPKVNPMSPMSFYVTPNNAADIANGNATNAQAVQQGANNANAQVNAANSANMWNGIANLGGLLAGNLFGKNGSQGGGGSGGGFGSEF